MQLGRVVFARHSWQGLSDVLWSLACLGLDARQATTRLQKLELSWKRITYSGATIFQAGVGGRCSWDECFLCVL